MASTVIGTADTDLDGDLGNAVINIAPGVLFTVSSSTLDPSDDAFDGVMNNEGFFSTIAPFQLDGELNMTLWNNGRLEPGMSAGQATIGGSYRHMASGTLAIELGGTVQGDEYDFLNIEENATLGGALEVTLINDFSPLAGAFFEILFAEDGFTGTFGAETLPELSGDLTWTITYKSKRVSLSVTSPYSADFDFDGDVDGDDLAAWESSFGLNDQADADNNGESDGYDFLAWQRQFGSGVSPLAAVTTEVPEPSTAMLALGLILFVQSRRPRGYEPRVALSH